MPGDIARIEADGKVTLLGRGSNCVNTGGEKVYPEEVEMAIKAHPAVYDCLVVGLPDEKYGQAVAAVVQPREGQTVELEELRDFLRASLSGYKLPRALTLVDEIPRNATGKAQYPKAKEMALASRPRRATRLMRTPLCDAFGIEYPIFAFTPSEHVAAAVSRAGGLGVLGCVRFNDADELERDADLARRQHRRQALRRRHRDADEDPHRGHLGRPRGDDPRGAQELRRRDAAQARRTAAAGGRGPRGRPRLAALGGPLARRRRAQAPAGADRQRARLAAGRRDREGHEHGIQVAALAGAAKHALAT